METIVSLLDRLSSKYNEDIYTFAQKESALPLRQCTCAKPTKIDGVKCRIVVRTVAAFCNRQI